MMTRYEQMVLAIYLARRQTQNPDEAAEKACKEAKALCLVIDGQPALGAEHKRRWDLDDYLKTCGGTLE